MIDYITEHEKLTRKFFKLLNKFMLLMWRLGFGPVMRSPYWGYIMVLTTTGHKSGLQRRAPVNFDRDEDKVYCLPGFGTKTHWYRNLMADPNCEVWLPDGWWAGVAEEISDPDEHLSILQRLLIRAGFATRIVEGIDPARISDEHLRELGERYDKTIRIRLVSRRTGPGGPGDLVWVWPALLVTGLALWGLRHSVTKKPND